MQITIHRGTKEVGGSCVEIRSDRAKILIDIGLPLDFGDKPQEEQEQIRKQSAEWAKDADAIFISHYHADHFGLLTESDFHTPLFMTRGTYEMLCVNDIVQRKSLTQNARIVVVPPHKDCFVQIGNIRVSLYTVDHAAFDACAFLVECGGRKILYSGDIRLHSVKGKLYHLLPQGVDCLLLEGTNLHADKKCKTENQVGKEFERQFRKEPDKLHYVWCSGQNIDRLVQLYKAALHTGRKLIIDSYIALILDRVHGIRNSIPSILDPIAGHDVFRYFNNHRFLDIIKQSGDIAVADKLNALPKVDTEDISHNPGKYVWVVRPNMLPVISKYKHSSSVFITSLWHGYREKETALSEHLRKYSISEMEIHTSGHADVQSLQRIVEHVKPKCLIPIHTDAPQQFAEVFSNTEVQILDDGTVYKLQ